MTVASHILGPSPTHLKQRRKDKKKIGFFFVGDKKGKKEKKRGLNYLENKRKRNKERKKQKERDRALRGEEANFFRPKFEREILPELAEILVCCS